MPTVHNYVEVEIDGNALIELQGSHSVRIKGGINAPNITGFDGGEDGIELNLHNLSGGPVTITDHDAAVIALDPSKQIHTTGFGGTFQLPDDQLVWMIKVDPNDVAFPSAKRGWYLDSGGQEVFARICATPTTSSPSNSGALAVVPEMSVEIDTIGGHCIVGFTMQLEVQPGDEGVVALYVDGVVVAHTEREVAYASPDPGSSVSATVAFAALQTDLIGGLHDFEVKWVATGGALRAIGVSRSFYVYEFPA